MHEIHCSIPNIMLICFCFFPCTYQYVPSTHQVNTGYKPGIYWYILVNVLEFQVQPSMYAVGTVLYWCVLFCIGAYYAIVSYHLVLPCSCTYHLVMQLLSWGFQHFNVGLGTSRSAQQLALCRSRCTKYQIEISKSSWSCVALQLVCTSMYSYRAVQDGMVLLHTTYQCSTVPYQVCTEFVLGSRQSGRTATSLWRSSLGIPWA